MVDFSRWCIRHRRIVVIAWIVIAVAVNIVVATVGRDYQSNFSLPGTDSQRTTDLLLSEFPQESGDTDQIVFRYAPPGGSAKGVYEPHVKAAITELLEKIAKMPYVVRILSPYTPEGAFQISRDGTTAFATVGYAKRANYMPDETGQPVIDAVEAVHVPGLQVAAGGQVIEQAEGLNVGPATIVGVVAALLILLITFGSLLAAGLPLVTAGIGLITGLALVGLATNVFAMSNISPDLAIMIGLGVGVDYALFIVTRFRENYSRLGDVADAVTQAMDTSGRAIVLGGSTVIIALLGMFATGVAFMFGLAIASILAVLLVLTASLTLLPALLSRFGHRIVGPSRLRLRRRAGDASHPRTAGVSGEQGSAWRRWSLAVQRRPAPLALGSLLIMLACVTPMFAMRLQLTDASNDPAGTTTQHAFHLISEGFGPGFNGPLIVAVELHNRASEAALPKVRNALLDAHDVGAVTPPTIAPSGRVAILTAYPESSPQAPATTTLVHHIRDEIAPAVERSAAQSGAPLSILVGGFTAGSIDFSHVMAVKLPLFIAIVVVLSALLLFVIFRSIVIPVQAALMNLLSIGGALGATVLVFQKGWLGGLLGVTPGPIEPWIPVLTFAVVFGLSMDYEVFLVSRIREEWVHQRDASAAVADGIAFTGRVITAAAAIMILVFLSFMFGNERELKEFGFGLAAAVFLDAVIVRCVMVPAVLQMLGTTTWKLPRFIDERLPYINIEGSSPAVGQTPTGGADATGGERPAPPG